jgi:SAM-dependent methyltransferase
MIVVQKPVKLTAEQIITRYKGDGCTAFHSPRYAFLVNTLTSYITHSNLKILDIGRSNLTELISSEFKIDVDTLGFPDDGTTDTGRHYHFNLNNTQWQDKWRTDLPQYDVIVMAEVLEHLYTSPALVLKFLKTLLKPQGVLILSTPNALDFAGRIKPLLGIHPYELIREDYTNPGHYREYTEKELRSYAEKVGFTILDFKLHSYFDYRYFSRDGKKMPTYLGVVVNLIYRYFPSSLKSGMTVVLQNPSYLPL